MLRMTLSSSVGQAKDYFSEGLSREGYYSNGQEMVGIWGGVGASKLGLKGEVVKEHFHALCDNLHPSTGQKLTPRTKANRRIGYDINFHAPKGLTLAYEFLQDKRILKAFRESVRETMQELEKDVATRVRVGGADEDRKTANLIWAEFVHFTARPVGGVSDPHLHAHCFTFNATFDETEGRWKAGQFVSIKKDAPYYEAAFHARLAAKVRALGYEIERVGNSFELVDIPRDMVEEFRRRTELIQAEAQKRGITTAKGRDGLAALTREKKIKDVSKSELLAGWRSRLTEPWEEALKALRHVKERVIELDYHAKAVDFAIKHIFERKSVVSERQLKTEALRWGVGLVDVDQVKVETQNRGDLLRKQDRGQTLITTEQVLDEEELIVNWGKRGKGQFSPINPQWEIEDDRLNADQRKAVFHLLRSRDRVTGIQGKAGTGKTTLMVEAAMAIRASGQKLMVVAPTSEAARGVLRAEGFPEAETVAQFLQSPELQEQARDGILWIDEAGLVSTRTLAQLSDLAKDLNIRVILSGDTGQHHAVERGNAFELMQKTGAVNVVQVEKIQRQKGIYREAVEKIAAKQYSEAIEIMDKMECFREVIGPPGELHRVLAADYVNAMKAGKSALVVSPTHSECREVTGHIRQKLKETGQLDEDRKWGILRHLDFSDAQKADSNSYKPGQVIKLHRHVPGVQAGKTLVVEGVEEKGLWVRDGELDKLIPINRNQSWSVYEPDSIELAKGDQVRITANVTSKSGQKLNNGSLYKVRGFTKSGEVILSNGAHLGKDFGHITHGYSITSHSSQGKTVDRVFIAQSGNSIDVGDAEQFYVSFSRGRESARIYTSDLEMLKEMISLDRSRVSAKEVGFERKRKVVEDEITPEWEPKRRGPEMGMGM